MDLVTNATQNSCLNVLIVVKGRNVEYISIDGCMINKNFGSGYDQAFLLCGYASCRGTAWIHTVMLNIDSTNNILRYELVVDYSHNMVKSTIILGGTTTISSAIGYLRHGAWRQGCSPGRNSKRLIATWEARQLSKRTNISLIVPIQYLMWRLIIMWPCTLGLSPSATVKDMTL